VAGDPKIRFFAGAPLLSANSQVIGVFAIFGPEPRASFSAVQRRDLAGLSELATQRLTAGRDVSPSIILQRSPGLQPASGDGGISNSPGPTSSPPLSLEMKSHRISSVALRYHNASENSMPRSRIIINSEGRDAPVQKGEHTPPDSGNSDAGPSPAELKGNGKNYKQLSLAPSPNKPPNYIRTLESPTFGDIPSNFGPLQPRALLSDLDSLYQEQYPCRADFSRKDETRKSSAESKRVSNTFSSGDAAVLLTPHPNSTIEWNSHTSSLSINSGKRQTFPDEAPLLDDRLDITFIDKTDLDSASASDIGEPSPDSVNYETIHCHDALNMNAFMSESTSPEVLGSVDVQAEARFAAELWAKNLEFDAVYAVELIPKRKLATQSELKAPGNVETRILVAYGLPDPINFDIPVHLNVLYGSGAITWENKNAVPKEYSLGFMMPLLFENGVLDYRSSGVVFGAFRRRSDGINELPNLRSAEVERLQEAATVLKDILRKSPWLRRPSQGEAGPLSSPSPQQYPANKAIEVSKDSLGAGMAMYARRKKP